MTNWILPGGNEVTVPDCTWNVTVNIVGFAQLQLIGTTPTGSVFTSGILVEFAPPQTVPISITYFPGGVPAIGQLDYDGTPTPGPSPFTVSCP
jgi:hypothetical protein